MTYFVMRSYFVTLLTYCSNPFTATTDKIKIRPVNYQKMSPMFTAKLAECKLKESEKEERKVGLPTTANYFEKV